MFYNYDSWRKLGKYESSPNDHNEGGVKVDPNNIPEAGKYFDTTLDDFESKLLNKSSQGL